jgi:hypothetical protein
MNHSITLRVKESKTLNCDECAMEYLKHISPYELREFGTRVLSVKPLAEHHAYCASCASDADRRAARRTGLTPFPLPEYGHARPCRSPAA